MMENFEFRISNFEFPTRPTPRSSWVDGRKIRNSKFEIRNDEVLV